MLSVAGAGDCALEMGPQSIAAAKTSTARFMTCLRESMAVTLPRVESQRVPFSISRLFHLHDTPRRTAAAFALGVFFSFSPFLGLQIALSMALAFLLGLNRLAVLVGLN